MNILVIAALWPEPTSSAAGRRMMDLLKLFCEQGWHVTYACTASESENAYPLGTLGIKKKSIAINNSSFDIFISKLSPEIVMYDRFMVEEQFSWRVDKCCPTAMTILETSDLHCLRYAREAALKKGAEFMVADLMSEQAYREIASIQRTDLSLIISTAEMELLRAVFKVDAALIHYFPFMSDPDNNKALMNTWRSFEERNGFMCIGNFKHAPNWDSVQYLKKTIWPLIREKLPQAELAIYGAYPPSKAMQLHKPKEGFFVQGRADNVQEVMEKARVCLAPIRFGAGLKGKLLEAMEYGTPSVTSAIGAEAMHAELPWNGSVCDDPEEFANAAIELHENKAQWLDCQQRGSDILQQCFLPKTVLPPLLEKIDDIRNDLALHRQQNFQGGMLKHHLMRGTKYMSLWIEEKNKVSDK
ncbi:MAG: glycosyltransferase [Cycloclasticus sp. symbiont of Bathymodiolus heckerae]|nr:MAG: glycosyltransferase [Cycloclasticus sp. symbiont of Bathymodiolus heckerae]